MKSLYPKTNITYNKLTEHRLN